MPENKRLISLDVLRGLTVMLMIFVNNGAGEQIFAILKHEKWNGMTPCDLVFPFFLFMVGMSTCLSLRKTNFAWSARTGLKILKRGGLLFLIGLFINWFDMAVDGRALDFRHLRIMGVMQRIGLCYAATALIAIAVTRLADPIKTLPRLIVALLLVYGIFVLSCGGYNYDATTNGIARIDLALLGYDHLYHKSPVDPEGLSSTLPAVAHCLLGFWVALWALRGGKDGRGLSPLTRFLLCGAVLTLVGYLVSTGLPLNKRIWSPSYVLVSCGFACLLQGLLICFLDEKATATSHGGQRGAVVNATLIFGTNPLFLYLASEIIAIAFGACGIKEAAYNAVHSVVTNGYWASVVYAAAFLSLHIALGYPLWKRKIYIKL